MHRDKKKYAASLLGIAAATSVLGLVDKAYATTYTVNSSASGVAEAASLFNSTFFDIGDAGAPFPGWGAIDFPSSTAAPVIPNGQEVTAVGQDLTVNLWADFFGNSNAHNATIPVTMDFYLATDTATSIGAGSPLRYETSSDHVGGLNNPGNAGSFAAGTSLYSLGSATLQPITLAQSGTELSFSLATAFADPNAQAYVLNTLNAGGNLRLVVASEGTDTGSLEFYSPTNSTTANIPTLSLDLTTGSVPVNGSLLYVNSAPQKSTTVNLGTLYNGTYTALKGVPLTAPVTLLNGSSTAGNTLLYKLATTGAGATSPGINPITPGASTTAQFGFSAADTNKTAGSNISGSATFTNQNNPGDAAVTVSSNSVHIVELRFVNTGDSGTGTGALGAPDLGKVLVGSTVSAPEPLFTTNSDTSGDFTSNTLTTLTVKGNSSAANFSQKNPFTSKVVATIGANTTGLGDQVFDNQQIGTVNAVVSPTISGVYGDARSETVNGTTKTFGAGFADFSGASVVGDGLVGEVDDARSYIRWEGYQAAAVTGNTGSALTGGSTATLANAVTNDDKIFVLGVLQNDGLRSTATITGINFNQTGWTQSGFSTNQILNPDASVNNSVIGFSSTSPSNKINGTYGATMTVHLQNDQTIQGTGVNDVAPISFPLQAVVSTAAGSGAGAYTLDGGTLTAPATNLTGSFTQTGGTSSFAGITGTGTVAISGGTASLTTGSGLSTVGSLAITGTGTLDIGNNHVIINYGAGTDPIASIAALIKSGFNGGMWTGLGITSAAAAANSGSYGIGYADSADPGNPAGLSSGQIEIKYTLLGDANLDGAVNGSDFAILATNFNKAVGGWDQGDFNYDGAANGADFALLASNFNKGASQSAVDPSLVSFAAANGLLADVPEPASMGLLAISGISLLARRKRRVNA